MTEFARIYRLPLYIFNTIIALKLKARAQGIDVIDFGGANLDGPTLKPVIADKLI